MNQLITESEILQNHYSGQVVNSAMKVHTKLGAGLLESVYEACLIYELRSKGLDVRSQVELPIKYEKMEFDVGFRMDLLVQDAVVVELKAVEKLLPVHKAQLLSYLRLSGYRVGLLINFNTPSLRNGIHRIINGYQ